jgi:multisubunit Na+/H+ antiporter MnhB subunit
MQESIIHNSPDGDLIGAIVSGLFVGSILAWTRFSGDELHLGPFITLILMAIGSYLIVALVLSQWKKRPIRKVPNWILIAVVGSLITFISINLLPDLAYIWRFRDSSVIGYASGQMQEEIIRLTLNTILDSLIALPTMAVIRRIVRSKKGIASR